MLIKLFIDAGWYTVPFTGSLVRLENGKKSLPNYPVNYRVTYKEKFNTSESEIGAAFTGKESNIVALDCDNQVTYDLFRSFDPEYKFLFESLDKPQGGGTIIYKYKENLDQFNYKTEGLNLEFFSDGGLIYLPLEKNYTKVSWKGTTILPEIKEIPLSALTLLNVLKTKKNAPIVTKTKTNIVSQRLFPIVLEFINLNRYYPLLFKIITPKAFRDLPDYVNNRHLPPNKVPDGRGMEYLVSISAILGADISINVETYLRAMTLINSLWTKPLDSSKLKKTITDPMIEKKSKIDDEIIWNYDQHWKDIGFHGTASNGDSIESFYDDIRGIYYLINYSAPYVKAFSEKRSVINVLKSLLGIKMNEFNYDSAKQLTRTILAPHLDFGIVKGTDQFNLFRQTEELSILNNPSVYKDKYKIPQTILNYLDSFIPNKESRDYVLSFLKTKLTTFKHSPVILYFIGKPGSGKDTLIDILGKIVGEQYIAKPSSKVFLETHNGWFVDKYFIQLNEYGNTLTRYSDKQEALGKLKAYTGSDITMIRAMQKDGYSYTHRASFIMTANNTPLSIEMDDRRFHYVKTPNALAKEEWVLQNGGMTDVYDRIFSEVKDFCYYLGTEVKPLNSDAYMTAPETEDKEAMILDNMLASQKIVYFLQNSRFDDLKELAEEHGISNFTQHWNLGRLMSEKLTDLYLAMTEDRGNNRTLLRELKTSGFSRLHTTSCNTNIFYFHFNTIHLYQDNDFGFEEVDSPKINL